MSLAELSGKEYYKRHIEGLLGDTLRQVVENIEADYTYRREKQPEPWSKTIPRVCTFIETVAYQLFKADTEFTDFFDIGFGVKRKTVGEMIKWIRSTLMNRFSESPPFTILHFVESMAFLTEGIDTPLEHDSKFEYSGLRYYKKRVNNLVCDEQCENEVLNAYYEEEETCEYSKNNIYAVKYLRALINILSVESNVDEVSEDLKSYGSKNILRIREANAKTEVKQDTEEPGTEEEGSTNSIKMVRIPWYDPSTVASPTDNGDNNELAKD